MSNGTSGTYNGSGSRLAKTASRTSSASSNSGISGLSSDKQSTTNNSSISGNSSMVKQKRTALNWRSMVNRTD